MNRGFWDKLKKPIFVLAPMANVTDAAFRRVIAKYGKPDVTWTEFVSTEALMSKGRENALVDFWFTEAERPIVAQIFGADPEKFFKSAQLIRELGFDGIDINMGCPDRNVEKQGAGACLIKNPTLAKEIILATKEGAKELPVSVKTRIGYNKNEIDTWLPNLLETEPAAITIHARTRKEMSLVPAHWEVVAEAVKIRDSINPEILILGNGDVENLTQAEDRVKETGADGVMIGRGIFGNPWLFSKNGNQPTLKERLNIMVEHTLLFEKLFTGRKPLDVMKKHYKAYVKGFEGAPELRAKLMQAEIAQEIAGIVKNYRPEGRSFFHKGIFANFFKS